MHDVTKQIAVRFMNGCDFKMRSAGTAKPSSISKHDTTWCGFKVKLYFRVILSYQISFRQDMLNVCAIELRGYEGAAWFTRRAHGCFRWMLCG